MRNRNPFLHSLFFTLPLVVLLSGLSLPARAADRDEARDADFYSQLKNRFEAGAAAAKRGVEPLNAPKPILAAPCPSGDVLYVKGSATGLNTGLNWTDAFTNLQDALAQTDSCPLVTQIWVAVGTYYPGEGQFSTFRLRNNVGIYGGFSGGETLLSERLPDENVTILSGDVGVPGTTSDNSYHIVTAETGINASALLDGFTIQRANADYNGGGMYMDFGASPSITGCTFRDNLAFNAGAAMAINYGSPAVYNCTFLNNVAFIAGAILVNRGAPLIRECTFGLAGQGNIADNGAAVFCDSTQATFELCNFIANSALANNGGAVDNAYGSNTSYTDCFFQGNIALRGGALHIWESTITVEHCTFRSDTASFGGGVMVSQNSSAFVRRSLFENNVALGDGGAVYMNGTYLEAVSSSFFFNTSQGSNASGGSPPYGGGAFGLFGGGGGNATIVNCSMANNQATGTDPSDGGGGIFSYTLSPVVSNCILWGNVDIAAPSTEVAQIHLLNGATVTMDHTDVQGLTGALGGTANIGGDPLFVNEVIGDLHLVAGSPAINAGNNAAPAIGTLDLEGDPRIHSGTVDMGAHESQLDAAILYVDATASGANNGTSWTNAFVDLQDALAAASAQDEIWVAGGTYTPTPGTDRFVHFALKNGVAVYGGFAGTETLLSQRNFSVNETILSGEIGAPGASDNTVQVVTANSVDSTTVLDGFTVTAGNADTGSTTQGGGITVMGSGGPTLANLIISNNAASVRGGGLSNSSTGGLTLTNVIFSGNSADVYGGGMSNFFNATATLNNVIFTGNSLSGAYGGGMANVLNSTATLNNVVFSGNSASVYGGGMANVSGGSVTLTNVTFSGNFVSGPYGGGMANVIDASMTAVNTILWGNTAGNLSEKEIFNLTDSTVVFSYSLIDGSGGSSSWNSALGSDGGNNLDADPLFANEVGGDLRLSPGSPAQNAGNNLAPNLYDPDLAGNPRVSGGNVDMGAYESPVGPNLRVVSFNGPTNAFVLQPASTFSLTNLFINEGPIDINTPFSVGVYLSVDDTITSGDILLTSGQVTVSGLKVDSTASVSFPSAAIPQVPGGQYYIGILLDDLGTVGETNEWDNFSWTLVTIDGDGDLDGVLNSADGCPLENASMFDSDGNGCLDFASGARHIEYWATVELPIHYSINDQGAPGISDGTDFTAIQNAVAAWTLPGTQAASVYDGTTTQRDADALDEMNLVTFEDPDFLFPAGVLAVGLTTSFTEPTYYNGRIVRPGQIIDSDMIFNAAKVFKTSGAGPGSDIESVATHEAGHLFGLAHSSVRSSTMFYVLPGGIAARSLAPEDIRAMTASYPAAATTSAASRLQGTVTDGRAATFGQPIPGAIVFAISVTSGDSLGCTYTLPDGSYLFLGLPNDTYYVAIHPLNGSSAIGFIKGQNINSLVQSTAITAFVPEYFNDVESSSDDPADKSGLTVTAGLTTVADLITNADTTPPVVVSVSPAPDATGVPISTSIVIKFSEPILSSTLQGNFSVRDTLGDIGIAGNAAVVNDDSVVSFIPTANLKFGTVYRLRLESGLQDHANNGTAVFQMFFTTEPQPPVSISSLIPTKGVVGSIVTIAGAGFDPNPSQNAVTFDGISAAVQQASETQLVVVVPGGAATGAVEVTAPAGTSNTLNYTVLTPNELPKGFEFSVVDLLAVPRAVTVRPSGSHAFVATATGVSVVNVDPGDAGFLTHTPVAIAGGTDDVASTPDGKRVYATSALNQALYRLNADPVDPFAVLNTRPIGFAPRGILITPGGQRAYVPTNAGDIQIWDVSNAASPTFEQQIGVIASPDPNVRGKMATDPAGNNLLVLTGTGKMLVFELSTGTVLATIPVGPDPRDVAVDPTGQFAYVTDNAGQVSVVSLSSLMNVATVPTGGTLRGASVTPGGGLLYAVNRELNLLNVIDLQLGNPTYRSVAANVPQRVNPVDIALAPDGFYAYTLSEAEMRLVITAIGVGPGLNTLSQIAGPVGAKVVLVGSDLNATATTAVTFNGINAAVEQISATSITVSVPVGATSGPVRVVGTNPAEAPQISNSIFFQVLGPSSNDALRLANVVSGAPNPFSVDPGYVLAMSPTGKFLMTGDNDGESHLFDTDPASPTYNQYFGDFSTSFVVEGMAITPDGKRALLAVGTSNLHVVDVNRLSPGFLSEITINIPSASLRSVAISPDGSLALVTAPFNSDIHVIELDPNSPNVNTVIYSLALDGNVDEIAFHPSGQYAYMPTPGLNPTVLYVLATDRSQPNFLTVVSSPSITGSYQNKSLAFTPDGSRCLMLSYDGAVSHTVHLLDTSDPLSPLQLFIWSQTAGDFVVDEHIRVSPRGDRAIAGVTDGGLYHFQIATAPDSLVLLENLAGTLFGNSVGLEYQPDASRFHALSDAADSLYTYDFTAAQTIAIAAGNGQAGVANQVLAAPLRAQVSGTGSLSGVPVTFRVVSGGGVFTSGNLSTQTVATDAAGTAEVSLKLGAALGSQVVEASSQGLLGSALTFTATAVANPDTLPLSIASVTPIDGKTAVNLSTATKTVFTRAVDPATITGSTFYLHEFGSSTPVPTVVGFTNGNREVSLTPVTLLQVNTQYVIEMTAGIQDTNGGALQNPQAPTFTTSGPPPLVLTAANPPSATVGITVVLSGTGFDPVPANNMVTFAGVPATVQDGSENSLTMNVPVGATTGKVRIQRGATLSNEIDFTVLVPQPSPANEVLATIGTGTATRGVSITPDGALAYAVSPEGDVVVPIDLAASVPASLPAIPVGDNPVAVVINPEGTRAYVANYLTGSVSVIDIATNLVVETIFVGTNPVDLAIDPEGERVIVANQGSNDLSVVDSDNLSETYHQVLATIGTGTATRGVSITPDGGLLYVGTDTGYIVMDGLSYGVLATIGTGTATRGVSITPDGALLIVLTTEGEVLIFDIVPGSSSENQVLATIGTGTATRGVSITPDGALMYLVQEEQDVVLVVSLSDLSSVGVLEDGVIVPPSAIILPIIDTIVAGEDPSDVVVAPDGSGRVLVTNAGDNTVTLFSAEPLVIVAKIRMTPRTLNLKSKGKWVKTSIELPVEYSPADIVISSVRLQGVIPAHPTKWSIEDDDKNGIDELHVRFDRSDFQAVIPQGDYVEVVVTGDVLDKHFAGVDTIRTHRPKVTKPAKDEIVSATRPYTITWDSPAGIYVHHVDVEYSLDDGENWAFVAEGIPNAGSVQWTPPFISSTQARVSVTLFEEDDDDLIVLNSGGDYEDDDIVGIGISDKFIVAVPVSVSMRSVKVGIEEGSAVVRWETSAEYAVRGFRVHRSDDRDGPYIALNDLVPAANRSEGSSYEFRDTGVRPNRTYYYRLEEVAEVGVGGTFGPYAVIYRAVFGLEQNIPNPFNPTTTIRFTIPEGDLVRLAVYDVSGRVVRTLVSERRQANFYKEVWDGRDDRGEKVASGIYFYRLDAGKHHTTKKMLLLK